MNREWTQSVGRKVELRSAVEFSEKALPRYPAIRGKDCLAAMTAGLLLLAGSAAFGDAGDIIFDGTLNKSLDTPGGKSTGTGLDKGSPVQGIAEPTDALFTDERPGRVKTATQPYVDNRIRNSIAQSERRMERKMAIAEADTNMYEQMRRISNWLSQYCVWNKHWPDPGDQENDAIRQLNDLCPNNPYQSNRIQESSGFSTDPIYQYYSQTQNQVADASSGYEGDSLEPTTTYGALGDKRIRLVYDPSLTSVQADEWRQSPPEEWAAPPGTITAISNSNDLIVIWGAGVNGRPLRVPGANTIRLFVSTINMPTSERSNY